MKKVFVSVLSLIFIVCMLVSVGCGGCGGEKAEQADDYTFYLSTEKLDLSIGQSYKIKFLSKDNYEHFFTIDDQGIATVDKDGVIFAKNEGVAVVTVTSNNVTKTCKVTVTEDAKPVICFHNVENNTLRLIKGQSFNIDYSVILYDKDLKTDVELFSDNVEKASIKGSMITAVDYGTAEITLSLDYLIWSITEKIDVQIVEDISLILPTFDLILSEGDTYIFESDKCYVLKDDVKTDAGIEFQVFENEEIVSITGNIVQALRTGNTKIKALYNLNGKTYTNYVFITVNKRQLPKPTNLSVYGTIISWDKTESDYCAGYRLFVDDTEITSEQGLLSRDTTFYDLKNFYLFGSKLFRIIAVSSDENFVASSETEYLNYNFMSVSLDEKMQNPDYLDAKSIQLQTEFTDANVYYAQCCNTDYTKNAGYAFIKTYFTEFIRSRLWYCRNALIPTDADMSFYNGKTISFWVYAPERTTFRHIDWSSASDIQSPITVEAFTWTKVSFTVDRSKYKELSFICASGNFYYTDIRISVSGYSVPSFSDCEFYCGYGAESAIDALIAAHYNGEVFDQGSLKSYENFAIERAFILYNNLSEDRKALIDSSKIEKYNVISEAYNDMFLPIETMTDKSRILLWNDDKNDGLRVNANISHPYTMSLSLGKDDVYGGYIDLDVHQYNGTWTINNIKIQHSVVSYRFESIKDELSDCINVVFYVYNGADRNFRLFANFGGTATDSYKGISLTAKEWTKVEIPVKDFLTGSYFGIAYTCDYGDGPYEFKVSGIFGERIYSADDYYVTDDFEPVLIQPAG